MKAVRRRPGANTVGNREQRSNKESRKKALLTPKEKKAAKRARKDASGG